MAIPLIVTKDISLKTTNAKLMVVLEENHQSHCVSLSWNQFSYQSSYFAEQ